MHGLITNILAYSRADAPQELPSPVACEELLRHALANLQAAVEESKAEVTHDPLPVIKANATQITQLFQNLVSNAIKFRGANPPRIHVGAKKAGPEWTFWVRDNGIGIDPKLAGKLFQPFRRLHGRREYPGNGVGLAICKRIVERHGGRI